jgi:hypothetical protein
VCGWDRGWSHNQSAKLVNRLKLPPLHAGIDPDDTAANSQQRSEAGATTSEAGPAFTKTYPTIEDLRAATRGWDEFVHLPLHERVAIRKGYGRDRRSYRSTPEQHRFLGNLGELPNGCWSWRAKRSTSGARVFKLRGEILPIEIAAYMLFVGPVPHDSEVFRRCGEVECVRPDHLAIKKTP